MKFYKKALNALIQNGGNKTKTRRNKTRRNKSRRNKTKTNKTKRNQKGGENPPQSTPLVDYESPIPGNISELTDILELNNDEILEILKNEDASPQQLKQIIIQENKFVIDNERKRLIETSKLGYVAILKYNKHPEIDYDDYLYHRFERDAWEIIYDSNIKVEGVVYYNDRTEFDEQFTNL